MLYEAVTSYHFHENVVDSDCSTLQLFNDDSMSEEYLNMRTANPSESLISLLANQGTVVYPSIDFHCYPWILKKLETKTGLQANLIKQLIWVVESRVNERKPSTRSASKALSKSADYQNLYRDLYIVRSSILQKALESLESAETSDTIPPAHLEVKSALM
jgi:hypothetical protein